ncbi:MAG: hypothetical protein H0U74_22410 [Bradymonadaceae bacterium]|nr:hypothetical protein [Lujinxingiaceae bacterium]
MHDTVDYPQGPRLEIFRAPDASIVIQYDVWMFRLAPGEQQIAFCTTAEPVRTCLDLVFERVVVPLYVLFAEPSILGLHGSAVAIDERGWIFIGESGAGKSTTAHALLAQGATFLADDMTLVDVANGTIRPGSPSIRLWKQSSEVQGALYDCLVSDQTTKRWFRLDDSLGAPAPIELAGIVWLTPTADAAQDGAWTPCRPRDGLVALLRQTFDFTSPERAWMTQRFQNAAQLLGRNTLFRYQYKRSDDGLPSHVERLVRVLRESTS